MLYRVIEKLFLNGAERLDVTCRRGDNLQMAIDIPFLQGAKNAICHVRKHRSHLSDLLLSFSVDNSTIILNDSKDQAETGIIKTLFMRSNTAMQIDSGKYYYDLKVYDNNNNVVTVRYGRFIVLENITEITDSTYDKENCLETENGYPVQTETGEYINIIITKE